MLAAKGPLETANGILAAPVCGRTVPIGDNALDWLLKASDQIRLSLEIDRAVFDASADYPHKKKSKYDPLLHSLERDLTRHGVDVADRKPRHPERQLLLTRDGYETVPHGRLTSAHSKAGKFHFLSGIKL
ncbi:hypothetical protein P775_21665 [Puniceibacterium antarcticum]|uniref:Uncharacterized protein n=1 Tax=Puniceibacterium antarcticum TaxID=1206336 RepID=A0A2G8R933_9RHOB|nr:hypothetical protein [Puniceibacterium antarcticum]PIL18032.1 hypothetical protein P775_21665 [Puniceibacterium antarcticum]